MAVDAYYLTAAVTCSQVRPSRNRYGVDESFQKWDACTPQIVFSSSIDEAERQLEAWLRIQPEGEKPREVVIWKITTTPFVDDLLTESGNDPLDWLKIKKQIESQLESTPVDDFEQGYWVDVNDVVRPDKLSFSAGTLQSDVPEDIRSGLNWSSDKQFFFFFSILLPPPPPPSPSFEADVAEPESVEPDGQDAQEPDSISPEEFCARFPEAQNKEAIALVQARNSVVAAWLWRRYAERTSLAAKAIRIDPWPGLLGEPTE